MDTSIGVVQVGNKQKLCMDKDISPYDLNFTFVNTGSVDLEGVQITEIFDNDAPAQVNVLAPLPVEKSKLFYGAANLTIQRSG